MRTYTSVISCEHLPCLLLKVLELAQKVSASIPAVNSIDLSHQFHVQEVGTYLALQEDQSGVESGTVNGTLKTQTQTHTHTRARARE